VSNFDYFKNKHFMSHMVQNRGSRQAIAGSKGKEVQSLLLGAAQSKRRLDEVA
jgi:hypothetical protein